MKSGVITSILGVSCLELHSKSIKLVNFLGAHFSLGRGTILVWGGTSSDLGPVVPGLGPPYKYSRLYYALIRHIYSVFSVI